MPLFKLKNILSSSTLPKLLLAGLLLAIPLYQKFPLIEIPGIYVRVRLEDFLMFFVAFYSGLYFLPKIKSLFDKHLERSIIFYWIVGGVSVVSGILITKTIVPYIGLLHLARRVEYMVAFFFALTLMKSAKSRYIDYIIKLVIVAVVIIFIYGVGQKYLHWPVIITQNEQYSKGIALRYIDGSHLTSTFAGHYDLSSYLVLILPILVTCGLVVKGKLNKLIFLATWIMGLWLLSNTLSRTSVISYFLAVGISLLMVKKYKEILVVFLVSLIVLTFSSKLFDRYLQIINVYAAETTPQRISTQTPKPVSIPVIEDRSTSIRINVEWPRAIRAFEKNPILGSGFSSITLATDNDYLRALGEAGILGLMSFVLIIAAIFKQIKSALPQRANFDGLELGFVAGVAGAMPAVLVNAVFIDIFESSKFAITFWLIVGIMVYLIRSKTRGEVAGKVKT